MTAHTDQPTRLTAFLHTLGYEAIKLHKSVVGHFRIPGTLNGHPIRAVLDTGASYTVIDLARATSLGLKLEPFEGRAGGVGNATMPLYSAQARLEVAGFKPQASTYNVMDLSHANTALKHRGDEPMDVIIGANLLQQHRAIIDYGSGMLFFQAEP
jgi:hypothetical protein